MSELDLLNLARAESDDVLTAFAQIVTITFAMVIGIYYFLNQAKIGLKLLAYLIYSVGMFLYFGTMIAHSNIVFGINQALHALPQEHLSPPTLYLIAVNQSWIGKLESVLITGGFWVLWLSIAYLLFFWRKADHEPRPIA
jgi:hypothetical protein